MAVALSTGIELPDQLRPATGGLLDRAYDLPTGWERGVTVPFYGCGEPILRDKCIRSVDEPHRDQLVDFQPFPIEQGATCSTLGGRSLDDHALRRLQATSEWALGRQLQTDIVGTGNPSLDAGTVAGSTSEMTVAVAILEQAAADTGFGTEWFLHAPVYAAAILRRYNLIDDEGRTPAGGTWVLSPGYQRPALDTTRLWATGPVWAGVDTPTVQEDISHRMNDIAAWALRTGLVAFDPCINQYVDVTGLCSTCGGAGGDGVTP